MKAIKNIVKSTNQPTRKMNRRTAIQYTAAGVAGLAVPVNTLFCKNTSQEWSAQGGVFIERQDTGAEIWQVTTEERSQWNIYCEMAYCSADSRYFVYDRSGGDSMNPRDLVVVEIGTWEQRVVDWFMGVEGCAITPDGIFYYLKRMGDIRQLFRIKFPYGKPEPVHEFHENPHHAPDNFGAVSHDHRYYVQMRQDDQLKRFYIVLVDLKTGEEKVIDESTNRLTHAQFDPDDGRQVLVQHNIGYVFGPDGNLKLPAPWHTLLYVLSIPEGKRTELQVGIPYSTNCTGHQAWIGKTGEILLSVNASGDYAPEKGNLLGVRPGSPARVVAKGYKFMHVGVSRCGRLFSADDMIYQDKTGANIIIGSTKTGKTALLCESKTKVNFPDPGPDYIQNQNTHPHPYLTPDLKWVIFNSSRSGFPHIYAAKVPEGMVEQLLEA